MTKDPVREVTMLTQQKKDKHEKPGNQDVERPKDRVHFLAMETNEEKLPNSRIQQPKADNKGMENELKTVFGIKAGERKQLEIQVNEL